MIELSDCVCIACGGPLRSANVAEAAIRPARYACTGCGRTFDEIWGVPFFLQYDKGDFAGLVEIAANADQVSPHTPASLDHFADLMAGYHAAADRAAFQRAAPESYAPWLPVRYAEWVAVEHLARDEVWNGLDVLDVGAGLGFDSYRHVRAGARVTALEFSPVLAREGKRTLPMIRWIGGAAHQLPFADGSFDAVFCNAALHHMRDIPASIKEMLRVLRPGGLLITTGDPYRADEDGEDVELAIFNAHAGVLLGVNEQVPRFRDFVDALKAVRDRVEPRLFTQVLYEKHGVLGRRATEAFREWDFDRDCATLRQMSGSLALKVRLKAPVGRSAAARDTPGALQPATVARWMESQSEAMAKLAAWAPPAIVNRPFPGWKSDRLELLNGWQAPTGAAWRQAYRRGRWYLRRRPDQGELFFDLRSEAGGAFDILVNGQPAQNVAVDPAHWRSVAMDVSLAPPATTFAVEIRLHGEPDSFEAGLFQVRGRRFAGDPIPVASHSDVLYRTTHWMQRAAGRLKASLRARFS